MDIYLYNTYSHTKEKFVPQKDRYVSIYNCGPTVYNTPHIGNFRTFILDDILRRVFEYNGYSVDQVMNLTDVDDKTIRESRAQGISLKELTRKYEDLFINSLSDLNILRPNHVLRATDHIQEMIDFTDELLKKGLAYKADDGVYLSIDKIPNYGKLANLQASKSGSTKERIANDEYDKENPRDFVLWKFHTENDGPVYWDSPFGKGRPGWHIECSAMSRKVLGDTIDIHTGGIDLIFPHHTNEIAQSESLTGKQFVRYWMHGAFMNVSDEKMAKSKHNFLKLEDLIENSVSASGFRYWLLTAHYRSPVNFTFEAVKAAQTAMIRMMTIISEYKTVGAISKKYLEKFNLAVNDDLDMPKALALAWELIGDKELSSADKYATLLDFDRVFGFNLNNVPKIADFEIPPEIQALAEAREEARKNKDWAKADALRAEVEARGFVLNDTPTGIQIRPI